MSTVQHPLPADAHGPIRMAEVLAALSLATDLGAGKPMGHALRACYLGIHIAKEMHVTTDEQAELYYSFLLMHSGCTALSRGLSPLIKGDELAAIADVTLRDEARPLEMLEWMRRSVSPDAPLPARALNIIEMLFQSPEAGDHSRGACEVAVRTAQRLGMPTGVQDAVRHYLERWDGKGPFGLQGSAIPLNSRLLHLALKLEAFHTARGRSELETWALEQKGRIFDPQLTEAALVLVRKPDLWEMLAKAELWSVVMDLEPASPYRSINQAKGQLSEAEKEKLRLHPYFTERILSRVPALAEVAAIAGKHHERMDGTGYYQGLSGSELPIGACILALADEFQEHLQAQRRHGEPDPLQAYKSMQPEVGTWFSPACFEALAQELGIAAPRLPRWREWPAGLTDREVEVLRLLARGLRNREIAQRLVITEKTVGHHLEHIFNKIGVSSRAAAVFFAMEHELIS